MIYRFAVEKICIMKDELHDETKWDFEVHPKVFIGKNRCATALRAEKHISTLAEDIKDCMDTHERIGGKLISFDPIGIHEFGCDEVQFEFENAIIRLRLVELMYNS